MSLGPLSLVAPWWLALLPLAGYAFWLWRQIPEWNAQRPLLISLPYVRLSAVLALVLACAGAEWSTLSRGVDMHVFLDRSASIGTDARRQSDLAVESILSMMGRSDRMATYVYGRDVVVQSPLSSAETLTPATALPDPSATNLEAAVQSVLPRVDERANTRFVVISDGIETAGDVGELIPQLSRLGIPVDIFPLGQPSLEETAVERLTAPQSVSPDEPYSVQAVVSATAPTTAGLSLYRDGLLIADHETSLEEGRTVVRFTGLSEPGAAGSATTLELRIRPQLDTFTENNVGFATVQIQGPAGVLVISETAQRAHALAALLDPAQIESVPTTPAEMQLDVESLVQYRAIIIDNVPAHQFSPRQLDEVAHYVQSTGGGLLVVGGERSFGLGGYRGTRLEEVLPVSMDAPQNLVMPSLAMVMVIDRSGSMAQRQDEFSKLDLAKEAALGVLDVVQDHDLLGVVAFDSNPGWVVPVEPVSNRVLFAAPIAAVTSDGGTNIGPALIAAHTGLQEAEAAVKHVLLLTDGISSPADFEEIANAMVTDGITISTVGIGRDADRELLRQLAEWGEGRTYYTDDIHSVPQIFATETTIVSRPLRVDEPFAPRWDQQAEFWSESVSLPALGGYVRTTAKAASAVHLRAPDDAPILSTWRHGLGRTAAFASSLSGAWGGAWDEWPRSRAFWSQLLRWLMRSDPAEGLYPQLLLDGASGVITVDALAPNGEYVNFLDLEAQVRTPDGDDLLVPLTQRQPGRYQAEFPARSQGAYVATIIERSARETSLPDEERRAVTVGAILPYPEEYRTLRPETGSLYRLALSTQGLIIRDTTTESIARLFTHPHPVRRSHALAPWLLALAFCAFLADIFVRYLSADVLTRARRALDTAVTSLGGAGDSPVRKLQERMRAEQAYVDELMQRRERSSREEIQRSAQAGRHLATRRKGEDEER